MTVRADSSLRVRGLLGGPTSRRRGSLGARSDGPLGTTEPYKRPQAPLDFRGPGATRPSPPVDEVVIGWFGPGDPDHPRLRRLLARRVLALEAGERGGRVPRAAVPARPAWSESPWKAGIAELTRLVYDRGAWAVIGGVDGTTTHLAEQVALKATSRC